MAVKYVIQPSRTLRDYLYILRIALFNQEQPVILDRPTIRELFKKAYPKAKV